MVKKTLALAALLGFSTPSFAQDLSDQFYKFQDQVTGEVDFLPIERRKQTRFHIIDLYDLPPCEKDYCDPTQRYLEEVKRREEVIQFRVSSRSSLEFQDRTYPAFIDTLREVSRFAVPIGAYVLDSQFKPDKDELLEIDILRK